MAALVLLDVTEYCILIRCLEYTFDLEHEALSWMESYLSDRFQHILIAGCKSVDSNLAFGVPQGSVLGPNMYCMYTNPLGEIIKRNGLK